MTTGAQAKTLAILCGGGPAPGINSVISSVTIEAVKNGWKVLGMYGGFTHLAKGEPKYVELTIADISRIHFDGGSILRMSRYNPTKREGDLANVVNSLTDLGVTHLVTIGGDDTAYSATTIAAYAKKNLDIDIRFAHVPKTIDNDLPLPLGVQTFGFETARTMGSEIVRNLMVDAATTDNRWYFAIAMGRTAGHLALGIGKSAGATLTIIPEEFEEPVIRLQHVVDILVGAIAKRHASGRNYGVAVIAEGVIEKIAPEDLGELGPGARDEHGHIRYAEIDLGEFIKQAVLKELAGSRIKVAIVDKEIGYEIRCAPPLAYDIEYTRDLGYATFEFLRDGGTDAMITVQKTEIVPLAFEDIRDPHTGKTKVRKVDLHSIQYKIAREYMIRLDRADMESDVAVNKLALLLKMLPEEFREKYGYVAL